MWDKVKVKHVVYFVSLHLALNRNLVTVFSRAVVDHAKAEKGQSQNVWNYYSQGQIYWENKERSKSSTWCTLYLCISPLTATS